MKKLLTKQLSLIFSLAIGQLFAHELPAQAATLGTHQISQLFVFGDSLVDDGNLYALTEGQYPPSALGYYRGRFSNGKVFVEDLPQDLKKSGYGRPTLKYNPANNYAIAGAGTTYNYFLGNEMGLDDQINQFFVDQSPISPQTVSSRSTPSLDSDALYLIAAGANDYLPNDEQCTLSYDEQDLPTIISTVTQNLTQSLTLLADAGAKNFAVTGIADPTIAPAFINCSESKKEFLKEIARQHNLTLMTALNTLEQDKGLDITYIDLNTILKRSRHNFTNTQDACLDQQTVSQCTDPNHYLFWDDVHLTAQAHKILALETVETYREKNGQGVSIPEPDAIFGLLAVAGLSYLLKRKPQ